ncbi:hypothetical protein MMB232_01143 [Brevundimonas subvibrioides]|uniref:cell wall hydrolase n=1 Tax=Brevundimonas subvibrioides TaxID=74313 RepID=UPI0032D59F8A
MSLNPPQTPSRLHRLVLILQDQWFDLTERLRLWSGDRDAVRRACVIGLVVTLVIAGIATVVAVTRYGRQTDGAARAAAGSAPSAGQVPDSPLDFTLTADQLRDLTAEQARALNATMPVSTAPDSAAPPFVIPADSQDFQRAVDCMTAAIYYEAANEGGAGQAAVAQVILNRMRHSAYPGTVCGVVFQGSERQTGCQFSFTCDGALGRPPEPVRWAMARGVAISALSGGVAGAVGHATHYHADYVSPYWAPRLAKVGQIGAHIFYRWPGVFGRPTAFGKTYRGAEPEITKLRPLQMAGFGFLPSIEIVEVDPMVVVEPIDLLAATGALPVVETSSTSEASSDTGTAAPVPPAPPPAPVVVRAPTVLAQTRNGEPSSVVPSAVERPQPRIARPSDW